MKPQKKAVVAKKATKSPTIAKKRRVSPERTVLDLGLKKNSKKQLNPVNSKKKTSGDKKKLEKSEDKKKLEKLEDKKKLEKLDDKKKLGKPEDRKKSEKSEDKKKLDEKKLDKPEMIDEKVKQNNDSDKKSDKIDEKRTDKFDDAEEEGNVITGDSLERKKIIKPDEKGKVDKQVDIKKKGIDKMDEKKRCGKLEADILEIVKSCEIVEDRVSHDESLNVASKKKNKEEKKKDTKQGKPETKDSLKCTLIKEKNRKKLADKEGGRKTSPIGAKKESKAKELHKKNVVKKTVLAKKLVSHLPVSKKLIDKKVKLVKMPKNEGAPTKEDDDSKKAKKKNSQMPKTKIAQEKRPKLAKQMKAKMPSKHMKLSSSLKKQDKLKALTEKIIMKKKAEPKDTDKAINEIKKSPNSSKEEVANGAIVNIIKKEAIEMQEDEKPKDDVPQEAQQDLKKSAKPAVKPKTTKKAAKKATKLHQGNDQKSSSTEDSMASLEELSEESKIIEAATLKNVAAAKQDHGEGPMKVDLKVETVNGDTSGSSLPSSESEDEEDSKRSKRKISKKKERVRSPSEDQARRMRLLEFWSGSKRHRVASLNALAKVHCLYENEAGGVYLGGFCKPKPEKERQKKVKDEKEDSRKAKDKKPDDRAEENVSKRKLRNVPGLRGKHWDMMESSSTSSSSSDEECEKEKNAERGEKTKRKVVKRRKKNEEVMDLKDMVVCKRMASLNASAILAASYSDEKNRCGSSSTSESSSDSEVELAKKRKQSDTEVDRRKSRQGSDNEDVVKPSKKVVIVNQDTDVTITGVYVNQTRSTHHEGFCSIAGMQYRISSTSHTQTAATAVATELHDQKQEQPCKSYTPLGALSSMQPPGSQGNHPAMSPRRQSAFSAPHQHGYYQPAGPLIQHPPTLPPVKGPPPEPTPTPPQNSEGSDDLVATSTTSGGTSSTAMLSGGGGFYRAYCPQYYGTPPQYQELCYPPTYSHPHQHPPPYYKYAPTYRRQYYGYQESGGGGGPGGAGTGGGPGVVDYQPPPPPAEYPPPPYYGGYPPPPPPPPPPPNPAYLHAQGRPFVDHAAFQGCPCPMQSCPKNVDTGPLIGNGKGAPVVSGPGLSLPPSALVGPPSPARGLAGLAPPHGANAWDTDRVQLNTHRNLNQNQPQMPAVHNLVGCPQNPECRTKNEKNCQEDKLRECGCQKHASTSSCGVKLESMPPTDKLTVASCPGNKLHNFKLENNNVKCESCRVEVGENLPCAGANCDVKCESGYKCEILKCEQCMKEGQMAILEIDKDSGILMIDDKLEADAGVKEELKDGAIESENWKKPDYEPTVQETVEEKEITEDPVRPLEEAPKCQKVAKRKLSLDSLSDNKKKRKVNKRTLSVGSAREMVGPNDTIPRSVTLTVASPDPVEVESEAPSSKKKPTKKDLQGQKRKAEGGSPCEAPTKKPKHPKQSSTGLSASSTKTVATGNSIMDTINRVIQRGLQHSQKRDKKSRNGERPEKKKSKKKQPVNLLSTIKKVTKKIDLVKEVMAEKLGPAKGEARVNQAKGKADTKARTKTQDAKSKAKVKTKLLEVKSKLKEVQLKVQDPKSKETSKRAEAPAKGRAETEEAKKLAAMKKKRKSTKKVVGKKANGKAEDSAAASESLTLVRKPFLKPKWSNGWSWEGDSYEAKVYLTNEESAIRRCYSSMKHVSGDVLRPLDCVLLKSGPRKADLPFVAKIAALWENPDDGEMMFSLLWYYRPEHTEQGRTEFDTEDEVFASRHRDANSVACIEDKCYILTFNEYCRYRKNLRRTEEGLESPGLIVPPGEQVYPRENRQPPIPVPSDMVLFCRRVYDYRGKKLVKNPG
ncbi:uncharacterized protein LOC105702077 isoform X2 [Orussus abietinus]|uniref:uncharacterized protein LOC105702077 isoform X2 n=1 Tax=Orussus abietinus TaxID=222816 RepID=UPI000626743B|nr:uncharacterized protein LOC105702077 isoform X2 [Orussus abietinus]